MWRPVAIFTNMVALLLKLIADVNSFATNVCLMKNTYVVSGKKNRRKWWQRRVCNELQIGLDNVYTWHDSVRLLINIRKSSVMIIGNIWLLSLLNLRDVRGSPHKGQWRGAMIFSLICAWTNGWVNNRYTSDLRHQYAHNDVTVMNDFVHDYNAMPLELFERAHLIGRPIKSDIIFSVRMQNLLKQMYYFGL